MHAKLTAFLLLLISCTAAAAPSPAQKPVPDKGVSGPHHKVRVLNVKPAPIPLNKK